MLKQLNCGVFQYHFVASLCYYYSLMHCQNIMLKLFTHQGEIMHKNIVSHESHCWTITITHACNLLVTMHVVG